jgi:hypothetical protein
MNNQWYDVFSTTRLVYFLAGMLLATAYWYRKLRKQNIILDLTPLGIIAGVAVVVFIAIQQVGLAADVKHCQTEFNTVLQDRAKLSDQSDTLAGREIEANAAFFAAIANPPPDVAALNTTDPVYRDWVHSTMVTYLGQLNTIRTERERALEERKERTYPQPTCGI